MFRERVKAFRLGRGEARTRGPAWRAAGIAVAAVAVTAPTSVTGRPGAEWVKVAHWAMDETSGRKMTDSAGGHDGRWKGVGTGLPGHAGRAYAFDGRSSYAFVRSVDALNPGPRDIRLTVWMKTRDKPDRSDWDLFRKGYAYRSPGRYKVEYQPTGRASCDFADRAQSHGAGRLSGGPDLADGRWHRVTCTKTSRMISLTVDSHIIATKKVGLGQIANSDPVVLGAYRRPGGSPPHGGFFRGMLDEAVIEMR